MTLSIPKAKMNPATTIEQKAISLCQDYKPLSSNTNDWNVIWFTRRQLNKLRQHIQQDLTVKKQPSKECIEYALQIAEKFHPITADTFDWELIYFTRKQLNQFTIFCQTKYIPT